MRELFRIYAAFFRVGLLTFGGGYAMLPVLQREIIERKGWVTEEETMDFYALAQCLPGLIMVNTSTFIGNSVKGASGGFAAALGAVTPSFCIILGLAALLTNFSGLDVLQNAFAGIRVCVVVLIVNALVKLWKKALVDWKCMIIFLAVCGLSVFTELSPIVFVISAALMGIFIKEVEARNV